MNTNHRKALSLQPQIMLLIIAALLLLPWLGTTWFNSKGEPREAIVAMSILQSGEWILPVNYGGDIPYKPPFLYWLIAIFAKIFNGGTVNEYVSRLPSALACIAMIWAGYRWSARLRGERFGMIMALVTLTSVEVFRAAIACRLDMVVTATIVTSIYLLFDLRERDCRHRKLKYLTVILLMSAGTLTKGPIGSLIPCMVAGVYCLLCGDGFWRTLGRLSALCLCSFILPALWFLAASRQGGEGFTALMLEENLGRMSGTMSYSSHEKPFWYNFVTLLSGMAPWTLLGVLSLTVARSYRRRMLRQGGLLALLAVVLIVGFYCIPASKRSVYLLPVYPFIAYGVASLILHLHNSKVLKSYVWILAVTGFVVPVAVTLALCGIITIGKVQLWPLSWWMWPLLYLPALASLLWLGNRRDSVAFAMLLPTVLLLTYAAVAQPMVLKPQSDRPLAEKIKAVAVDAPVYSLNTPEGFRLYSVNFYTADRLRPVEADSLPVLPQGSVVIYNSLVADSTLFGSSYSHMHLTDRSADHRNPLSLAIKD